MSTPSQLIGQSSNAFFFLIIDDSLSIDLHSHFPNFYPIFAYHSATVEDLKSQNIPHFCLQDEGVEIETKNSGRLLDQKKVQNFIASTAAQRQIVIIPFKPSAKIETICRQQHWLLASNPASLNRLLEDKIKFYQLCQDHNIPTLPSFIAPINAANFRHAQELFGQEIVVQTHFGWAGNSTFIFNDFSQIHGELYQVSAKFSPYIKGYSLLNNCSIYQNQLLQSQPALQYTGLFPYTNNPFSTVGRQWPSQAPSNVIDQVTKITQDFSQKILIPNHYRGFFGLDFIVDDQQKVYLLECNPRLTASFAFYTSIEIKARIVPLFFYHLAEFANINIPQSPDQESQRLSNPDIIGSELTYRNHAGQIIYKYNDFQIFSTSVDPVSIDPKITNLIKSKIHEI